MCVTGADVLPTKFASPPYVATKVSDPTVRGIIPQLPCATVAVQLTVPSDTVTLPVGVPPLDVTVKLIVIDWPTTDGSGTTPVMVAVVEAWFTVCATPDDVLPLKLASPPYVAVSVLAPAVVEVSAQLPAATVPTQLSVPSLTVTLPVGVPPLDVTLKLTVVAWPTVDGSGTTFVTAVLLVAGFTVWLTPADVLPLKLASPA